MDDVGSRENVHVSDVVIDFDSEVVLVAVIDRS